MNNVLNVTFASSLTRLCEINSSFDSGVLKICYTGENRNGSYISKEAIINSMDTIYNCPIVCNYNREEDTLGGHDIEIIKDLNGNVRLVNITQPVGVIPESSNIWFEEFEEDDGTIHEYLCAEVLIWKRQEAYNKIKNDGITKHSMEITVKDGEKKDGLYYIYDFEFTAFALIGVEPCFEGSALEMFSKQNFKQQLSNMMQELKESNYILVNSSTEDDIHPQKILTEGGESPLDKVDETNDINDTFSAVGTDADDVVTHTENTDSDTSGVGAGTTDNFALTSNIVEEIRRSFEAHTVEKEWGTCLKYLYIDSDLELCEVYCFDTEDWLIYGFSYEMNGDSVIIDFDSKKRKKYVIVDFDEGDIQDTGIKEFFSAVEKYVSQAVTDSQELTTKYEASQKALADVEVEMGELRAYKQNKEAELKSEKINEIFSRFDDLVGIVEFESLRDEAMNYEPNQLEEKCYMIRGKNLDLVKFSQKSSAPKFKIEKTQLEDEKLPYGGVVEKYNN